MDVRPGPLLLFGVGAPKAGTSWLYRTLCQHPQARMKAVKELHYFDTFEKEARARQIAALERNLDGFIRARSEAEAAGRGWQVDNMTRRIVDLDGLLRMLTADRAGDAAYLDYLAGGAGPGTVVADITPAYALQDTAGLARMAAIWPETRFVYLMRDPVERLWSHVRMQATRQLQAGEEAAVKAERILNRVVNRGLETHIPMRGDYRGTLTRLLAAVPRKDLLVEVAEEMFAGPGLARVCAHLGIEARMPEADAPAPALKGEEIALPEGRRQEAARFLRGQYDYVERLLGRLPEPWRHNRTLAGG